MPQGISALRPTNGLYLLPFFYLCHDVCSLVHLHDPNEWVLFIDSSEVTLKFVLLYKGKGKGKAKVHPRTGQEGLEVEQRYSSTLSLTSALDGVGGQRHCPAALPPGNTRYPLCRRNLAPPPGFDPRTFQPVASRFTD